jgi:arylformamidase
VKATASPILFDLSPPLSEALAVWPGDTPLRRDVLLDMDRGDNITLSSLHATVHLGAHADAPSHYGAQAPTIDARPLDFYIGPCQVVRVSVNPGEQITPAHLPARVDAPRVLLATGTYPDPTCFRQDFAALDPGLVEHLHRQGVRLVGIDTPSVDPSQSIRLPAHRAFLKHNMAILEGLVLDGVPAGVYELIALPLRLVGFDASPVRAVLRALATPPSAGASQ